MALQHSQFVENRVYEEDENVNSFTKEEEHKKVSDKSKLTPLDEITLAIDNGLAMLNDCYEKVSLDELNESDNDDEDEEDKMIINTVFRPKDAKYDLPFPLLIGSKEWKEKWHIGLLESDIESDDDQKVEEFSDSSSNPSLSASLPSNAATTSESEASFWGLNNNNTRPSTSHHDIFQESEDDEDNTISEAQSIVSKTILQSNPPQPAARTLFAEQKAIRQVPNLFDDIPPEIIEYPRIVKPKPVDIFEDDDDDDNDDDHDNFFTNVNNKSTNPPKQSYFKQGQSRPNVNLFDDTPPPIIDESISSSKNLCDIRNNNIIPNVAVKTKTPVNIFDDDLDDDFNDSFLTLAKEREPEIVQQPIKNQTAPKTNNVINGNNSFQGNDDPDNIFSNKNPPSQAAKVIVKKNLNLFSESDDDQDDDFDDLFKQPRTTITKSNQNKTSDDIKRVQKAEEPKRKVINLFDDDEDNEADDFEKLFKNNRVNNSLKTQDNNTLTPASEVTGNKKITIQEPTSNIFSETKQEKSVVAENNDIISDSRTKHLKSTTKPSLFDQISESDEDNDFDSIFMSKTTKKSEVKEINNSKAKNILLLK